MPNSVQIRELKEILIKKRETLFKNINGSRENIDLLKDQDINDDLDYAEVISDSFTEGMIANHQVKELEEIELALRKVEDKSYGICDMCGVVIPLGRLKAKPFAKFCTECRSAYEKEEAAK